LLAAEAARFRLQRELQYDAQLEAVRCPGMPLLLP
jgi:hypothetical protein